jgi:hypothetical protein
MTSAPGIPERLAQEEQAYPWWERPTLTTARAIIYVGLRSEDAFRKRMSRWSVSQCDDGMWPRHAIDRAMTRISKRTFQSNRGRNRATA